jgi:putative YphP/YqiW family bacilliredoxin
MQPRFSFAEKSFNFLSANLTALTKWCYFCVLLIKKDMPYPEMLVAPMRNELTSNGFTELKDASSVETAFSENDGTTLVVINSVCGCAAGSARPGILKSLQGQDKPDRLLTVFAGQDIEATAKAREFMAPYPPSSPAVALFKNGELVHMVERHMIEGRTADMVADNLMAAYSQHCHS